MNIWRPMGLSEKGKMALQRRTQRMCNPEDLSQTIRNVLSTRRPKAVPPGSGTVRRHAAVLVPLLCQEGDWTVLFTKRTDKVAHHKGQISFPGGAIEAHDPSPLQAMLRESEEEIGLKPEALDVLGSLDEAATMASNFIIHPFVGMVPSGYAFEINPFEVESILTCGRGPVPGKDVSEPGLRVRRRGDLGGHGKGHGKLHGRGRQQITLACWGEVSYKIYLRSGRGSVW
jgi:8-oxo-dGTP pyrophosphatase MutT (NUDIX family)